MTSKKLRRLIITVTILIFVFWAGWQGGKLSYQKAVSPKASSFSQKLATSPLLLETLSSL